MLARVFIVLLICWGLPTADAAEFPGKQSDWQGFARYDFKVDGRTSWIVTPEMPAEGNPWIWRARFFGHEPQADIALLKAGFHLAYCDVGGLFGSPQAVKHWNAFYKEMTEEYQLARRPALEGMSRGGLIIYNWAASNPDKVACIYGDAPVCDFKSWPAGKGLGKGSAATWAQCLKAYGLTEEQALAYRLNPIDNLLPLARAGIPLLNIVGDADVVVPVAENTAILEQRYKELGGAIEVIHKPGVGHHPHSLKDPAPIVTFVLTHTRPNIQLRGRMVNSGIQFSTEKKGHVAFIGGSITQMNGYRPMVCDDLQKRFPGTQFTFTAAGISSTCSTSGAFRLQTDVLSKGPVDLFFIEFAVNDDQDAGHARQECIRGMEGILRQVHHHNPRADIVITHFVNPGMLGQLQKGMTPVAIQAHSDVARHYGASTIYLAKEIAEQTAAGTISWQQYGGTHPKPFGNRICADMISRLLDRGWSSDSLENTRPTDHPLPASPLDPLHYGNGRFIALEQAHFDSGWEVKIPDWKSIPGSKRSQFTDIPMLSGNQPGAEFSLKFSGTAVGAYLVAGPDAGIVEVRVDDGDWRSVNLYHRFSKGLHYPRTVMFGTALSAGTHTLTLRISRQTENTGNAVRIMQLVAN